MMDTQPVLQSDTLEKMIDAGENALVEFKERWHDLSGKPGKAELIKDILAMANALEGEEPGFLIFGVSDEKHGGGLKGIAPDGGPSPDQFSQLIGEWTHPTVNCGLQHVEVRSVPIDVMTVNRSKERPHFSKRNVSGVLRDDVVYIRCGATIRTCSGPEIERMIRLKEAALGPMIQAPSISLGVVDLRHGRLVVRVTNHIEATVSDVNVFVDVALHTQPDVRIRQGLLYDTKLAPSEHRECQLDFRQLTFPQGNDVGWDSSNRTHRWLDLVLRAQYRDRDGLLRMLHESVALTD